MAHLGLMQRHGRTDSARTQTRLVIGPWNHNNLGGRKQGSVDFGPAATSAADTDFFVRLVDEDPGGPAMDVAYGMVRARHRHSLDEEDFIAPEAVTEYRIRMTPTACRFLAGHRIRLEITSSDFPNHDRNHNTGGNDLAETELVAAIQEVHHSREYPSRLVLPVLP